MQALVKRIAVASFFAAPLSMSVIGLALGQAFSDSKSGLVDYASAQFVPRLSCSDLERYTGKELVAIRSASIAADGPTPAHCRVTGTLAPEIAFEVSLPQRWNGRLYMIGNGGHAGEALDDPLRTVQRSAALAMGFAFAQTNTGHDARKEPGATFVLSNPEKALDYAYRAVHLTALTAKDITSRYYSRPIARSYWNSCSNGGRQGLIEAQRFPEDFDGLVVNAPWIDQTGFTIGAMWNERAVSQASPLTPSKLALLSRKVMERCDALDGLRDGVIEDPRKCDFDARRDMAACPQGTDGPECLTAAQAEAIMKIYGGPRNQKGALFPGYMPGSEAVVATGFGGTRDASAWLNLIVPARPDVKPADFNLAENTMRYLVHVPPQPDYDYGTFNFDRDVHLLDDWGEKANATNPDLSRFRARGGKLLMTYGWADPILQPLVGVRYYEQAIARNGPHTADFFRLFMVPGMTHCAGGKGTDRFDSMTVLIDWVEKNRAPASIRASHLEDNKITRTRPLCPYPQVAHYSGRGSSDDAANFSCGKP
ncbi:MAG TPA: tannase/feruloyl esterase family alpha/beta hydrolase [Steroidobacteraceae bacterium]|nr:tannase/feruloyl esterase family alpha/beta hydrolase [Steroidobacteraceae bacterium]